MWSFLPEDGYDASLMLPHQGALVYILILGIWSVLTIGLVLYLIVYRQVPAARYRSSVLSTLCLPPALVLPAWMLLRPLLTSNVTCFVDVWGYALSMAPWVLINACRFLRMLHLYKFKMALLEAASQGTFLASLPSFHVPVAKANMSPSYFPSDHPASIPGPVDPSMALEEMGSSRSSKAYYLIGNLDPQMVTRWCSNHQSLLTERSLILVISFTYLACILLTGLASLLHGPYPSRSYAPMQCMMDWPSWVPFVIHALAQLLLYPVIWWMMNQVGDARVLRRELEVYAGFNTLLTAMLLFATGVTGISQVTRNGLFLVVGTLFSLNGLYTSLIIPVREIQRSVPSGDPSAACSSEHFTSLLQSPEYFSDFLLFSLRDFSVENPLFYCRYYQIHERLAQTRLSYAQDSLGDGGSKVKALAHQELNAMYATFLTPGCHYEVNVPRHISNRVRQHLDNGVGQLEILDEVLREPLLGPMTHVLGLAFATYRYRHTPAATHRSVGLTLLVLPSPLIIPPWAFYRALVSTTPSCYFDLWCFVLTTMPNITFNLCRLLRMLHVYKFQEAMLDAADQSSPVLLHNPNPALPANTPNHEKAPGSKGMGKSAVSWSFTSPISHASAPKPRPTTVDGKDRSDNGAMEWLSNEYSHVWWFRYRGLLTEKSLIFIGSAIVGGTLFLNVILTLIRGPYPNRRFAEIQCPVDWPFWPASLISNIIKCFLYPAIFFFLREAQDAYGIRREFQIYGVLNSTSAAACFAVLWIPGLKQSVRTGFFITFVLIYALNSLYTTYVLPLRDIMRYKRRAQSKTLTMKTLRRCLDNPDDFHAFLLFSVKDFSVENALFHRRYEQVAKKVHRLALEQEYARLSGASSDHTIACETEGEAYVQNAGASEKFKESGTRITCSELSAELENVYSTFLAPDSHYELNVSRRLVLAVRRKLDEQDYRLEIFQEVLDEVHLLMFQNTYPRFVEHRRRSLQARTIV
ncbi:hypothetical protein BJ684DRAFT_19262 [Piptocephalis cylindrospora]|uniref:RGS domain-containing protein n=1 Tax=Piptocephalis cylindrospora TaxID=1907219 RepID=A0A4P9Y5T8_9FUNG|nr:hypothetical protein BJ684DRAFT_19262 [Piptocephalis cylindrospora]|eukprot:RKP14323.1 hypothetical protein BJ684DRAFT_19262 [Piptocephalis cylindrospora]